MEARAPGKLFSAGTLASGTVGPLLVVLVPVAGLLRTTTSLASSCCWATGRDSGAKLDCPDGTRRDSRDSISSLRAACICAHGCFRHQARIMVHLLPRLV